MALRCVVGKIFMKLTGKLTAFMLLEHLINLLLVSLCMMVIVNILHLSKYAVHYQGKLAAVSFANACVLIDDLVSVSEVSQAKQIIFKPIQPNDRGYLLDNEYQIDFYDKKQMLRLQSSDHKGHMPLLLNVKKAELQFENEHTLCLTTTLTNKKYQVYFYPQHFKGQSLNKKSKC